MTSTLCNAVLERENQCFRGTGGRSEENRALGFAPAFMDMETGLVYRARFSDGSPAPFHLLDGLPDALVATRTPSGRVATLKSAVVSGFVRGSRFFTRDEAASWTALHDSLPGDESADADDESAVGQRAWC